MNWGIMLSVENSQSGPHSVQAERALLGSILLDNGVLYQALNSITETDFFGAPHRVIFPAMCKLAGVNQKVNAVTLCEELTRGGNLDRAGGPDYVAKLASGVPLGADAVAEYVGIVRDKSIVRALLNASRNITARCLQGADDVPDLLESAHAQLFGVAERMTGGIGGPQPVAEIVTQMLPELDRTVGQGIVLGVPTGYSTFDSLTAGFQEGELVILAARPSLGKSALALDFLRTLAQRGIPVGMFNLEMSKKSLILRLACRISRLDSNRLRFGKLSKPEFGFLLQALAEVSQWPMWLDDSPGLSIDTLRWRMRSLAQQAKTKLQVVDHIQLVTAKAENRTQEVTRISGGLQCAAREIGKICGGTVLALSQLSRIGAQEEPQLHHLRESGSIEQDADVVLFLWDKLGQDPKEHNGCKEIMLKVAKQRNGPTGINSLLFFPERVGFEETDWTRPEQIGGGE